MLKSFKNNIIWIFVLLYLLVALSFAARHRNNVPFYTIDVRIIDSTTNYFIEKSNIIDLIQKHKGYDAQTPVEEINIAELEALINAYPAVKEAEIYQTVSGKLRIEIKQRHPIIRIVDQTGQSYYIDREGYIMPLSDSYTARVLVANGAIGGGIDPYTSYNVLTTKTDSLQTDSTQQILKSLHYMGQYIKSDKFWDAQIEQIYVDEDHNLELIPRVGMHSIFFGKAEAYEEKFTKLHAFYLEGLPKVGWNRYESLNLTYDNQIVCLKKEY